MSLPSMSSRGSVDRAPTPCSGGYEIAGFLSGTQFNFSLFHAHVDQFTLQKLWAVLR